jgi:hypothetical protein
VEESWKATLDEGRMEGFVSIAKKSCKKAVAF